MRRLFRMHPLKRFAFTTGLATLAIALVSILASHGASAQAQPVLGSCPGPGVVNGIPNQFCNATITWLSNATAAAQHLFLILIGIELAWTAILYAFQKEQLGEFVAAFLLKMMGVQFFFALLLAPASPLGLQTLLPQIMQSFLQLGNQVTGQTNTLDPAATLQIGLDGASKVFANLPQPEFTFSFDLLNLQGTLGPSLRDDLTIAFAMLVCVVFAAIIAFVLFVSFVIVAGEVIMTMIEAYVMIGAGAVMLGFTGSRWTMTFGERYIGYAIAIGIKLFVIIIVIGLGTTLSAGWDSLLHDVGAVQLTGAANFSKLEGIVSDYLTIASGAVVFMILVTKLPALAASMMNGSPSLTLGGAMASAGSLGGAVAGVTAAVAGAAKGAASKAESSVSSLRDASAVNDKIKAAKSSNAPAKPDSAGASGKGAGKVGSLGSNGSSSKASDLAGAAAELASASSASSLGPQSPKLPKATNDTRASTEKAGLSSLSRERAHAQKEARNNALDAVGALASGTLDAGASALRPLTELDAHAGGGSVNVNLRMPE
jgi:type IV secretion system protein TrbL